MPTPLFSHTLNVKWTIFSSLFHAKYYFFWFVYKQLLLMSRTTYLLLFSLNIQDTNDLRKIIVPWINMLLSNDVIYWYIKKRSYFSGFACVIFTKKILKTTFKKLIKIIFAARASEAQGHVGGQIKLEFAPTFYIYTCY